MKSKQLHTKIVAYLRLLDLQHQQADLYDLLRDHLRWFMNGEEPYTGAAAFALQQDDHDMTDSAAAQRDEGGTAAKSNDGTRCGEEPHSVLVPNPNP